MDAFLLSSDSCKGGYSVKTYFSPNQVNHYFRFVSYISHSDIMRIQGNDDLYPFRDVSLATPWPGLIQNPGVTSWKDRYDKMVNTVLPDGKLLRDYWDHPDYPFRIFKSHDVPSGLGSLVGDKSKVKILAMARNGLDTVVSATPFFKEHSDEFRKLWGGFPPAGESDMQLEGKVRLEQMMPGGLFEGWHFGYVNEWWKAKDEKNVLLLHYNDAKKDLRRTVKKLADFYGVSLTRNELDVVTEKCSFPYMKARTEMFSYTMPQNPSFSGHIMNHGSMTRNGIVGESKAVFSDEGKCNIIWYNSVFSRL